MAANYMLGKHLRALYVYPGWRNELTGAMTWEYDSSKTSQAYPGSATPTSGHGIEMAPSGSFGGSVVDYVKVSDERVLAMITAVNSQFAHYEKALMDFTLTVGEVARKQGDSMIPWLLQNYDQLKIVWVTGKLPGSSTAGIKLGTYTFYGTIQNGDDGIEDTTTKLSHPIILKPFFDGTNSPLTYLATTTEPTY